MQPALKPPGNTRLRPTFHTLLSIVTFKINLRRYNPEALRVVVAEVDAVVAGNGRDCQSLPSRLSSPT
jgi:hypothetical protein